MSVVLKKIKKEFIKNRLILKTQVEVKSKRDDVFSEKTNKIALNSNNGKRMQSINQIETNAHGISKDLIRKKEYNKTMQNCLALIILQKKI